MATLKDVAKRAGVSTATVSYVLNDKLDKVSPEVAERIREVMKELDYQPNMMARALRSRKTNSLRGCHDISGEQCPEGDQPGGG